MHPTRKSFVPSNLRLPFARMLAVSLVALVGLAIPRSAHAMVNVGAEGGIVKRSADSPNNLKLGFGYGAHAELDMLPLLKVGPYYQHYALSSADTPAVGSADATFNTIGLRARLILPIPGTIKPYGYVGAGYTWDSYAQVVGDRSGHFVEIPIGVGVADEIAEIFHLSLDFAYRPGLAFGGEAYDTYSIAKPSSGWSLMLGLALNL